MRRSQDAEWVEKSQGRVVEMAGSCRGLDELQDIWVMNLEKGRFFLFLNWR